MSRCDAEMCPFWTGQGCACDVFGIDEDDRDEQRRRLDLPGPVSAGGEDR